MAAMLLTTSSAARLAERSESCIRSWATEGLLPFMVTPTGVRLFDPADVRRVAGLRKVGKGREPEPTRAA